jgi:outer membrane protein W
LTETFSKGLGPELHGDVVGDEHDTNSSSSGKRNGKRQTENAGSWPAKLMQIYHIFQAPGQIKP